MGLFAIQTYISEVQHLSRESVPNSDMSQIAKYSFHEVLHDELSMVSKCNSADNLAKLVYFESKL